MELRLDNLNIEKERVYFYIMLVFSILMWFGIPTLLLVGNYTQMLFMYVPIGLLFGLFVWFGNGLLVAHLKSNCVKVDDTQLPDLYITFKEICQKFNISMPELYVLQSDGVLNAFAKRHSGRDFVVLNSSLIEDLDLKGDEIRFLIGHEIGHLKSKHILKKIFLLPASWIPLLAPAYHRACETSSDRFGVFSVNSMDGAIKALVILASGKKLTNYVNVDSFSNQFTSQRGFFISWNELVSGYPSLSHRIANILAIKNKQMAPTYHRHPLSYVFALFTFGGGRVSGGSFIIFVVVIALLSAIAIPNLLRAKMTSNDALARATLRAVSTASESYATANNGHYPSSPDVLTSATPPYLNNQYCQQTIAGYTYTCTFSDSGYQIVATPVTIGSSGSATYTISTGGVLQP